MSADLDRNHIKSLEEECRELRENLERVTNSAELLAAELFDPGTEALAAIYCARAALRGAKT